MPEYLKGNYKAPALKPQDGPAAEAAPAGSDFEKRALERLGGSIAFVMKAKTFLWAPGKDKKVEPKP